MWFLVKGDLIHVWLLFSDEKYNILCMHKTKQNKNGPTATHTSIINVTGNLIHAVCVTCSKSCVVGDGASCMSWYTACVIGCICCMCFLIIKHPVLKYNALVTCLMVYNLTESCSVFLTSLCVSVLIWFQSLSTVKLHSAGRKTICGH